MISVYEFCFDSLTKFKKYKHSHINKKIGNILSQKNSISHAITNTTVTMASFQLLQPFSQPTAIKWAGI